MLLEILQTVIGPYAEKEVKVFDQSDNFLAEVGLVKPVEAWSAAHRIAAYVMFLKSLNYL